jgi:hypothetical protein
MVECLSKLNVCRPLRGFLDFYLPLFPRLAPWATLYRPLQGLFQYLCGEYFFPYAHSQTSLVTLAFRFGGRRAARRGILRGKAALEHQRVNLRIATAKSAVSVGWINRITD